MSCQRLISSRGPRTPRPQSPHPFHSFCQLYPIKMDPIQRPMRSPVGTPAADDHPSSSGPRWCLAHVVLLWSCVSPAMPSDAPSKDRRAGARTPARKGRRDRLASFEWLRPAVSKTYLSGTPTSWPRELETGLMCLIRWISYPAYTIY